MKEAIKVVAYNPNWAVDFEHEKMSLSSMLGLEAIAIEHVGSTSVPGQEAKPIIDIFVGISPFRELAYYRSILDSEVYQYIHTGMSNRFLFNRYTNGIWTHNIHILPFNHEFDTRNELLFRDYLRKHPELVQEYGEVKKNSLQNCGGELEDYTRSKTEFIQKVVDAARSERGLPLQNVWED